MDPATPSFESRYPALAAVAYRVAYRVLGNRSDAEEVAQEALVRAYVRWPRVVGHDEAWVARVSMNLAIDRWRRGRRAAAVAESLRPETGAPGPEEAAVIRLGLVTALSALPRRQRDVVGLRYLADLSEREVAAALNTSVGAVKQHAHRGLARLRLTPTIRPQLEVDDVR